MIIIIDEASIEDAKKIKRKGEEIHTLRKGSAIYHSQKAPDEKEYYKKFNNYIDGYCGYERPIDKSYRNFDSKDKESRKDYYERKLKENREEYNKYKGLKEDRDRINNTKEKTNKQKYRDSTRSIEGTVPDHGANPRYSKDISDKAKFKYEKSKKYNNVDIYETIKDLPEEKKKILERLLNSGSELPQWAKSKLVYKKDVSKIKFNNISKTEDEIGANINLKKFKGDKDKLKRVRDLYRTMEKTHDYAEYKKCLEEIKRLAIPKEYKNITHLAFGSGNEKMNNGYFGYRAGINSSSKKVNSNKFFTGSKGLKTLTPRFQGKDMMYSTPRIYGADSPTSRTGEKPDESYGIYYYKAKGKWNKDDEGDIDGVNGSGYINTKKEIKLKEKK